MVNFNLGNSLSEKEEAAVHRRSNHGRIIAE